jgi:threonylcarbamoyladenosine tRNA methylthiotransferase MtaB
MTSFAVEFLGCKVALADSQAVRERLAADGHAEASPADADVRVVTTCCVTNEALAKSRKAVRRAARTAREVYVTGCGANLSGDGLAGLPGNVRIVRGAHDRAPAAVSEAVGGLGCVGGAAPAFGRSRAYVKIQDGCSFGCSYCVIPSVRGPSRSRSVDAVLRDGARRAEQGHRELVLTGINLGCFRDRSAGVDLAALLRRLAAIPGVERVRLSSIEVNHLTDRLLRAMAADERIAPHLHVPMQSGDDGVLAAMRRHYTSPRFLAKLDRARRMVPGLNLTSDVIVGHPSEDDAAFEGTLAAVRAAGFSKVHVFPYSPRPDTRDAAHDPVPPAAKRERSARLRRLSDRQGAAHRRSKLGSVERVLVEPGRGGGYSADYTPFRVDGAPDNAVVAVRATGLEPDAVVGTMCG